MNWLMVITGAIIGAPLRYLIDHAVQARHNTAFPWGTFTVNIAACAGLGFLTAAAAITTVPTELQHLIGPGLCATLSTYSTFSFESLRLAETGTKYFAAANALVSIAAGLGTAYLTAALATMVLR
ncbi:MULTISPECIES: fluoride efflux transporter FluC [Streptomyces]|uniref:Fluoride-specific ion channel FluC n=2 Tax=Streptomyces TaxID=1883 RepID=A0A1E7M0C9_9ACTN|nr:CrcB family protein [Streptomyces nanshensis]OEV21931.1 chromosome condensation protein CrcB [Streptomyces nanshensis]